MSNFLPIPARIDDRVDPRVTEVLEPIRDMLQRLTRSQNTTERAVTFQDLIDLGLLASSISGTLSVSTDLDSGTNDGEYASITHTHVKADITDFSDADYATAAHDHGQLYAAREHNHDGVYAIVDHTHEGSGEEITKADITDFNEADYATADHAHVKADITDFSDADYATADHAHLKADVTDFNEADYATADHDHLKADITDFNEADYATADHAHVKADITDFSDADYATADHAHVKADITDFSDADYATADHAHLKADITDFNEADYATADHDHLKADITDFNEADYATADHAHVKADITDFSDADYATADHAHVKADITDFSDADYATADHAHLKADITDFNEADYATADHDHLKADITDFNEADYATADHDHLKADITDFNEADYATADHAHVKADITDFSDADYATADHAHDADYAPITHTHVKGDITDFSDADYATADHDHLKADITDFNEADYATADHDHLKADITDFNEADYATADHDHLKADITDFNEADYATADHDHLKADITDFNEADYATADHDHLKADITDFNEADYATADHDHLKADITDFNEADYATAAQGTKADDAYPKAGGVISGNVDIEKTGAAFFNVKSLDSNGLTYLQLFNAEGVMGQLIGLSDRVLLRRPTDGANTDVELYDNYVRMNKYCLGIDSSIANSLTTRGYVDGAFVSLNKSEIITGNKRFKNNINVDVLLADDNALIFVGNRFQYSDTAAADAITFNVNSLIHRGYVDDALANKIDVTGDLVLNDLTSATAHATISLQAQGVEVGLVRSMPDRLRLDHYSGGEFGRLDLYTDKMAVNVPITSPLSTDPDSLIKRGYVDNGFLSNSGGTLTGDLNINKASAALIIDADTGTHAQIAFREGGSSKGSIYHDYANDIFRIQRRNGSALENEIQIRDDYVNVTDDLRIVNMGTSLRSATTKEYVDTGFLPISGGTLTGDLVINTATPEVLLRESGTNKGSLTFSNDTIQLKNIAGGSILTMLDDRVVSNVPVETTIETTSASDRFTFTTKGYVDDEFLSNGGGTLTGNLSIAKNGPFLIIESTSTGFGTSAHLEFKTTDANDVARRSGLFYFDSSSNAMRLRKYNRDDGTTVENETVTYDAYTTFSKEARGVESSEPTGFVVNSQLDDYITTEGGTIEGLVISPPDNLPYFVLNNIDASKSSAYMVFKNQGNDQGEIISNSSSFLFRKPRTAGGFTIVDMAEDNVIVNRPMVVPGGTNANPGLQFNSGNGMFEASTDQIDLSIGGASAFSFESDTIVRFTVSGGSAAGGTLRLDEGNAGPNYFELGAATNMTQNMRMIMPVNRPQAGQSLEVDLVSGIDVFMKWVS